MEMVFVCSQVLYVYCKALESVEFLPELARHATKALLESDVKVLSVYLHPFPPLFLLRSREVIVHLVVEMVYRSV